MKASHVFAVQVRGGNHVRVQWQSNDAGVTLQDVPPEAYRLPPGVAPPPEL